MAFKIYPTENDVGIAVGDGVLASEVNMSNWAQAAKPNLASFNDSQGDGPGGVVTGYDHSTSVGLVATLTAGVAMINGFRVEDTTTTDITLVASKHNHIFLRLDDSGGLVTGRTFQINSTDAFDDWGTVPVNSLLLWNYETSAVGVISQFDYRQFQNGVVAGTYTGDAAANRNIVLGMKPKLVIVMRAAFPKIWAFSEVGYPVFSGTNQGLILVQESATERVTGKFSSLHSLRPDIGIGFEGFTVSDSFPETFISPVQFLRGSASFDPPNIGAGADVLTTVTVTGAAVGDPASAGFDNTLIDDIQFTALVTAANTVTVRLFNRDSSAHDLGTGNLNVVVIKNTVQVTSAMSINESGDVYHFVAYS